jgi:hypothetical protein
MVSALSDHREGHVMTNRAHRLVAAGAMAVAAVAAPLVIASTSGESPNVQAQCRAHFGNIEDNVCMDGPDNGQSFNIGTPNAGRYGSNTGVSTGPMFPDTTWSGPVR